MARTTKASREAALSFLLPIAIAERWSASRLAKEAHIRKADAIVMMQQAEQAVVEKASEPDAQDLLREKAANLRNAVANTSDKLVAALTARADAIASKPEGQFVGAVQELFTSATQAAELADRLDGTRHLQSLQLQAIRAKVAQEEQKPLFNGVMALLKQVKGKVVESESV